MLRDRSFRVQRQTWMASFYWRVPRIGRLPGNYRGRAGGGARRPKRQRRVKLDAALSVYGVLAALLAKHALLEFATLLRFNGQSRRGTRQQTRNTDRFAGFLAVSIVTFADTQNGGFHLLE